ncbi:MAG TPA: DUF2946 family protein [Stellaceae bacterium]|jgi:hypothetical protein
MARIRSQWFGVRTALALISVLAQAAIPLLIAAEIAAASNAIPICSAATPSDRNRSNPHTPGHSCPICAAMAASAAVTATAPPVLPRPRIAIARIVTPLKQDAPAFVFAAAYRSRAPPQA